MIHYAKAVAHSALGNVAEAEAEKALFMAAKARVPESRRVHNNRIVNLLEVAEAMLDGELEYRKGNHDAAFAHLRRSVELSDGLPYDEPWGWMQPTRHALGALLLEQGRIEEAEAVYRSDLGLDGKLSRACQHPDNLWSLHGLHECLVRRGEKVESAADQAAARSGAGAGGDSDQGVLLLPADGHGGGVVAHPTDRFAQSVIREARQANACEPSVFMRARWIASLRSQ